MQTTRYVDNNENEQQLTEFFDNKDPNGVFKLYGKMNNRLFALEEQGHILVEQKVLTLKEKTIIEKGIPYRTILYAPGHVGLYAGVINGRAIMVHAVFGVDIMDNHGQEARNVIGKCITSQLDYGSELPNVHKNHLFLERLTAMRTPL